MIELRNPRTGQRRKLTAAGTLFGTVLFGPFYFMFKGAWGFGLILLALSFAVAFAGYMVGWIGWPTALLHLVVAFMAYDILLGHYHNEGFETEPTA